jgi:chemotaxis methyl-accepting protein methylase
VDSDDRGFEFLKEKIRRERGFPCDLYRDKCLRRRVGVRMRARGVRTPEEYAALLDREPEEYARLLDALTINVTKFFRNPETWAAVRETVLPRIFEGYGPVRIWSAGVATGEEAYTLAVLVLEWAESNQSRARVRRVSILGTDIDEESLARARAAEYPESALAEVPAEIRDRWFTGGPPYRPHAAARALVEFRRADLLTDPAPFRARLIVCRNVVIYLDRQAQARVYRTFWDALEPGGFLVLGRVETLPLEMHRAFELVNARERIFRRPG